MSAVSLCEHVDGHVRLSLCTPYRHKGNGPEWDTVRCFLSESFGFSDSVSDTVPCFLSESLDFSDSESDTVTCFLYEIYLNRTKFMVSVRHFGLT
jgi:hypothetical protein